CLSYYSTYSQLTIIPSSATSTLFPYTTLFRSGNPVLFQAGSSEQGRTLAARRAEAIYSVAYDLPSAQDYYSDVKARIRRAGREPRSVAIMPGLVTYVGSTEQEARAKQRELDELLPTEESLQQLGLFTEQDCTDWDLDAPVPDLPPLEEFTGPK